MKSLIGVDGGTRDILIVLAKGLGAFIYSLLHMGLLLLLAFAIILLFAQIISLHWIWIVLIMVFLWGAVSAIRSFIIAFLAMPYHYFARESMLVLILPAICIITSMAIFLIGFWKGYNISDGKNILCGLFITYECVVLVCHSIIGMFISRG